MPEMIAPTQPLVLEIESQAVSRPESVALLDGGHTAYPRMLAAIGEARHRIHLEVYAFTNVGVGARFVEALGEAASRGVTVDVAIDGWGSAFGGRAVASALRRAGCRVRIHNRLLFLLVGRFVRNHRKLLLIDDEVAFLGGINIDQSNVSDGARAASADLALEIHGPQCKSLGQLVRGEPRAPITSSLRILLCGRGGGWRLRRRYIRTFARAREKIHIAHGYFLPDPGVVRALTSACRRGVKVCLLLAGQTNHLLIRAATRSLYRQLLAAGVTIHEWRGSLLHAKVATVDGDRLLIGSFNLDRFSLANLETLVEVDDLPVVDLVEAWIHEHVEQSRTISVVEASAWHRRWLFDPLGRLVARAAEAVRRVIARRRRRRLEAYDTPGPGVAGCFHRYKEHDMRLSDENLRGRTVIGAGGIEVGEVVGLFVDSDAWRVESLKIKLRKDVADRLGAEHGFFHSGTLEIPSKMVQSVGDAVVLGVGVDQLREVLASVDEAVSSGEDTDRRQL